MALGLQPVGTQPVAGGDRRQAPLVVGLVARLVGVLDVDPLEPRVGDDRATGVERRPTTGKRRTVDPHRHRVAHRVGHLRGDRALPHQLVDPRLDRPAAEGVAHVFRAAEPLTCRTDGLVGLLGVLDLLRVLAGLCGQELLAVALGDDRAGGGECGVRQRGRVGPHVGDVALLVEALRRPHRLGGAEAQLAARLLLQRRGDERGSRRAPVGPRLDITDGEGPTLELGGERPGGGLVEGHDPGFVQLAVAVEVLAGGDPLVLDGVQPRGEGTAGVGTGQRREGGVEIPVGRHHEAHALPLAFDHDPGGHRLHPTGRAGRRDLAPEHLGHLVAVDAVQDPSCLLGVDEPTVDLTGMVDGVLDRRRGDLVEHHALDRHPRRRVQHLEQVPRNGLALAILIGGEIELVGILEQALQTADVALLVGIDQVEGLEVVLDIDAEHFPFLVGAFDLGGTHGEIADMANGRLDDEVLSEETRDGAGLGG